MKKKILLGVIAGVLTLTLGTATAFAASENFTDQNSDGVCDNFQSTTRPLNGQAIKKGNVTARSPAISQTKTATVFVTIIKARPARRTAQAIKMGSLAARKTVPATGTATNTVRNKKELL